MNAFLECRDISVQFPVIRGAFGFGKPVMFSAVSGVSLNVATGEIVGLVGESGCGKSTLAAAIMRLVPVQSGSILVNGVDITRLPPHRLGPVRSAMQMVFQDPYASLNPRMTVYDALAEPVTVHRKLRGKALGAEVSRLMEIVGLAPALARKYPHEFSGGQRQRIAIARALAVGPRMIIADEPVSSLDVSIQAQILNLLADLSKRMGLAMLFISHDLSVVRYLAGRILVMYRGRIVEEGDIPEVFNNPAHPYTKALIEAIQVPDPSVARPQSAVHFDAPSAVPSGRGCPFCDRCPRAIPICEESIPALLPCHGVPRHRAACFRTDESAD